MMDFENKTAVITGATRGIGRSIADSLWELGCNIVVTGRDIKPPKAIEKKERFTYLQLDFLDPQSLGEFISSIKDFSNVDILINNAGINVIQAIDQVSENNWHAILQVNLTGPMILMNTIAKIMKRRKGGKIVNISSIFGVVSKDKRGAYSASKSGLIGLTRAAALDLAKDGILVNALCPGFTDTELTNSILSDVEKDNIERSIPLQRFASADEIAKVALFLCSDLNTYMTGQTIVVDGGFTIA